MDLQTNASKVVELDAKIKKLSEQFAALKVDLMQQMITDNVSEIVIKRKKVVLCQRQNKDFGAEINRQELELKAEKKKLETLGEFTISSVTNFIQVRWQLGAVFSAPFFPPSPTRTMQTDHICTVTNREGVRLAYYSIAARDGESCVRFEGFGVTRVRFNALSGALAWCQRRPGRQIDVQADGSIRFYQ